MIARLRSQHLGHTCSPFESDARELRATVHCPQSDGRTEDDEFRLRFLRELAHIDSLSIVGTDRSFPRRMEIQLNDKGVGRVLYLDAEDQWTNSFLVVSRDSVDMATSILGATERTKQKVCTLALRLPMIEAHTQAERDLFITSEPNLLRFASRIPEANIVDLQEGTRIIGLYLRFLEDYTVSASRDSRDCLDREFFYLVLCRHRLPSMWRYVSACLQHGRENSTSNEELGDLAGTILVRCVRVLQARDEIGFQFYQRQNNAARNAMLYHFDYLTILLSGALDAEARIARRVYGIGNVRLRQTNFRNHGFRQCLKRAGALRLTDLLEDVRFQGFQRFLGALRNSVHSIGLRGFGLERPGEPESSFLQVFEDDKAMLEALSALGPPSDMGVQRQFGIKGYEVAIEPYTCAVRLCELGFKYVGQIAEATEVERLLATDSAAGLLTGPPDNRIFGGDTRLRVEALG